MTSKELKVGDWVSYKDSGVQQVKEILSIRCSLYDLKENFTFKGDTNHIEGIPLTKEILKNNRWMHHVDNGNHCYTKDNIDLWQCYIDGVSSYTFAFSNQSLRCISYVHELQNLLWALGLDDELKI